jgi:hypothetical protein
MTDHPPALRSAGPVRQAVPAPRPRDLPPGSVVTDTSEDRAYQYAWERHRALVRTMRRILAEGENTRRAAEALRPGGRGEHHDA